MSTASASIFEPKEANRSQIYFEATLRKADGQPLAGEDVIFQLDGQGSLSPGMSARELARETDEQGKARMTWYRRGIFGRDVNATLSVVCDIPDSSITLDEL